MSDVLIRVTDSLVAALASRQWSQAFAPKRSYADWQEKLDDTTKVGVLLCDVVPAMRLPCELETQGSVNYQPACDIVFRKKFSDEHQHATTGRIQLAEVDQLVGLVQEVNEFFCAEELEFYKDARWRETQIVHAVMPAHLRFGQFTAVIRISFDVSKAL